MSLQNICDLLGNKPRDAVARCVIGYFDGESEKIFSGELKGEIALSPRGDGGFGWDKIFIPNGYGGRTRAELTPEEDAETYSVIQPLDKLKAFLENLYPSTSQPNSE